MKEKKIDEAKAKKYSLRRKGFKFRLKITPEIDKKLRICFGHSRFVWNYFLRINLNRLECIHKIINVKMIKKDKGKWTRVNCKCKSCKYCKCKINIVNYCEMAFWITKLKDSQKKLKDLEKAFKAIIIKIYVDNMKKEYDFFSKVKNKLHTPLARLEM